VSYTVSTALRSGKYWVLEETFPLLVSNVLTAISPSLYQTF
jgi:hypothetical protein